MTESPRCQWSTETGSHGVQALHRSHSIFLAIDAIVLLVLLHRHIDTSNLSQSTLPCQPSRKSIPPTDHSASPFPLLVTSTISVSMNTHSYSEVHRWRARQSFQTPSTSSSGLSNFATIFIVIFAVIFAVALGVGFIRCVSGTQVRILVHPAPSNPVFEITSYRLRPMYHLVRWCEHPQAQLVGRSLPRFSPPVVIQLVR